MLSITCNGKPMTIEPGSTLTDLVNTLGLADKRIAVEHNQAICPKSRHSTVKLKPSDTVEIIHAVGGG